MSKVVRNVLYLGEQRDLYNLIAEFFENKENSLFSYDTHKAASFDEALEILNHTFVSLLIVDFCEEKLSSAAQIETFRFLKKYYVSHTLPIAGIFDNKEHIQEMEYLFGMGMSYAFIKGSDHRQALTSLFYIAYEDESYCLEYAFARGFKLSAVIQSLGYISHLNETSLTVDKDFRCEGEEVQMHTRLFEEFKAKTFIPQESFEKGFAFDTLYSENLQIEFASPWEESEDVVSEDTYTTWLQTSEDMLVSPKAVIFIYSRNLLLLREIVRLQKSSPELEIHFRESFNEGQKELLKIKPDLIMYDIDPDADEDGINELFSQIGYDKDCLRTIVSVFGHMSTSKALRKIFNRENILATTAALGEGALRQMLTRLLEEDLDHREYRFKFNDTRAITEFPLEAQVTSLTENEITFMTPTQLPFYTVLKMDIPVEMYVLIIPSVKNLSPNIHGYHYMGFIFGIEVEDSNYLRMFVNHIINRGLKEWKRIDFTERNAPPSANQASDAEENEEQPAAAKEKPGDAKQPPAEKPVEFRPKTKNKLSKL